MKTAYFKNKAEMAEINFLVKMFAFLRFVVCIISFEVIIISKTKFKRVIGPFGSTCFSFCQLFAQSILHWSKLLFEILELRHLYQKMTPIYLIVFD